MILNVRCYECLKYVLACVEFYALLQEFCDVQWELIVELLVNRVP